MFALSTEARLANVSINKEKAGEDNGRSAVVLDLECSAHAQWGLALMKGDLKEKDFHRFFWDDKHRRFSGLAEVKLATTIKDCCDIEVGTLTTKLKSTGVTAKKFRFTPSEGGMYELKFQLYVPSASHELLHWAYDNQLESVFVDVTQTQSDLVDGDGGDDSEQEEQEAA